MKNRILLFLSLPIFAIAGALLGATPTNAISDYDNTVQNTNTLSVISPDGSKNISLAENGDYSWYQLLQAQLPSYWAGQLQTTYENVSGSDSNHLAVIQNDLISIGNQTRAVNVYWSTEGTYPSNAPWKFQTLGPESSLPNQKYMYLDSWNAFQATITVSNDGVYTVQYSVANSSSMYYYYEGTSYFYRNDYRIEYPDGYEGEPVQSEPALFTEIDYWVNFTYQNSNTQLLANYTNKVTDPASSAPDPKYITWILYKDAPNTTDGDNVCETATLTTVPFDLNKECPTLQLDVASDYFLIAQINPTFNPDLTLSGVDITFKRTVFKIDFSTPSQGSTEFCTPGATDNITGTFCGATKSIDFTKCFTDSFPFVDPFECADNFTLIFNLLQHGNILVPRWNFNPNCVTLNTFDDWLNLPDNYQVCPQFPDSVRAIVTPFVAFMLGIVTVGFINRHNRDVRGQGF